MAYFVRPAGGSYGFEDGSSYDNAFNGWAAAMAAGVLGPGVFLYVCGQHDESSSTAALSAGGSVGNHAVIRGDYPGDPGELIIQNQWALTKDYVTFFNIKTNNSITTDKLFYLSTDRTDITFDGVESTVTNRFLWRSIGLMTNLTIKNSIIHNDGGTDLDYIIYCALGTDNREIGFVNLVLEDNYIRDCQGNAIYIRSTGDGAPAMKMQGVRIKGNDIRDCDLTPIRMLGDRYYVTSVTAGATTTFTLDGNHNYSAGDTVHIHDIVEVSGTPIPNGVYTIATATPGTNTFTVALDTTGSVYTTSWPYAGYASSPFFTDLTIEDNDVNDILHVGFGTQGGFFSVGCFRSTTTDHQRVGDNRVHNVWGFDGGGVFVDCTDVLYEVNRVSMTRLGPTGVGGTPESSYIDSHGVDIDVGNTNVIVRRNIMIDCYGNDSGTFPDNSAAGIFVLANNNVEVYGNLIILCRQGLMVQNAAHRHNNIVFANNTCIDIKECGLVVKEGNYSDTIYFWNNIVSNSQYGFYDLRNNNVIYGGYNTLHNSSVATYYQNGANYSTANDLTSDPLFDAMYGLDKASPSFGTGTKWWTGPNRVGYDGEPFSDFDTDRGGIQSKNGKFHPVNL